MAKFIFVTGGVVSGLGKGIAAEEASDGTNLDVGVAKMAFTIDCSAYNSAADFDIPEEALAAAA